MRATRHSFTIALAALIAACAVQSARALDDPARGKKLATQWCANCHLVSPEQTTASTDVPTFKSLAGRPESQFEKLRTFLIAPHPVMPNMSLSRQEIDDILAYILTLK